MKNLNLKEIVTKTVIRFNHCTSGFKGNVTTIVSNKVVGSYLEVYAFEANELFGYEQGQDNNRPGFVFVELKDSSIPEGEDNSLFCIKFKQGEKPNVYFCSEELPEQFLEVVAFIASKVLNKDYLVMKFDIKELSANKRGL